MRHSNSIQNSFSLSKNNVIFVPNMLVPNWHLCTEVDCTDILYVPKVIVPILAFNVPKLGVPKKTRTESVCTEIVLYRKRPPSACVPHLEFMELSNNLIRTRDVKRLPVYRLSFIFLVLVFEFQKPIIVSSLASSSRLKDASPRSEAVGRLVSLTHWHALASEGECRRSTTANDR